MTNTVNVATTETAQFQSELEDRLSNWVETVPGRRAGRVIVCGGDAISVSAMVHLSERLGPADVDIVFFDHDGMELGERIIVEQGSDLLVIAGVDIALDVQPQVEPVHNQRAYLRHDPSKNTKRRMRRGKGRK